MANTESKNNQGSSISKKNNQERPVNQGEISKKKDGGVVERRSYSEKAIVLENKGTGPGSPNKKKE